MSNALIIILTASFLGIGGALSGSFLVLRKMGMLADAISHAVLPGLVLGFWLAQGQSLLATFLGALAAGILTVALTEALQATRRIHSDAATGIIFASLFALGTFLVSRYFANVHLDADAVLYGEIAFAPFETLNLGAWVISKPLFTIGMLALLNLIFVAVFYKELKLATFDPGLAASLGFSPTLIHYALMLMVSLTTVAGFEAVGAIMVVCFLIVPAATAYLLTERLPRMLAIAVLCGVLSAVLGYFIAVRLDVSISGMMTVVAGALFTLAALFSPTQGVVWRALRRRAQAVRIQREDALRQLAQPLTHMPALPDALRADLVRRGLASATGTSLHLTAAGEQEAARLTRAHRLWETYLAAEGMPLDALHPEAHLMEHLIDATETDALDAAMGRPALDPHGDPIPRTGVMERADGIALTEWPLGTTGRISHVEDEPEETYRDLVRRGVTPGQPLVVLERTGARVRIRIAEHEALLPTDAAEQVQVVGA